MTFYISETSALRYLLHNRDDVILERLVPMRSAVAQKEHIDQVKLKELGFPYGIYTDWIDLNVPTRNQRSKSKLVKSHVWSGPSRGTYLRIDDEFAVQTPEACFTQLADTLPLPHLIELGLMLCGTYAPENIDSLGRHYDLQPLTTPEALCGYVARLSGKRGLKKARHALSYVRAGAESVMEAKLATWFSLSTRCGGCELKGLEENPEFELSNEIRNSWSAWSRRPDFLWSRYKVAADYDSGEYHDEGARAEADRQRRNELESLGLRNFIIRPYNIRNVTALERTTAQIAAAMGKTLESNTKGLAVLRHTLFEQLFGNDQWDFVTEETPRLESPGVYEFSN